MESTVLNMSGRKDIYFIGDTHYGNVGSCRTKFLAVVDEIRRNRHALVIGMGDYVESITSKDKRNYQIDNANAIKKYSKDIEDYKHLISDQWRMFEKDITPIADKIIGLHLGNHEISYVAHDGSDETSNICDRHNIKYLGDGTHLLQLSFRKKDILIHTQHGKGMSSLAASHLNTVDRFSRIYANTDIVAAGHTHKLGVNVNIAPLELKDGHLCQKIQYHCSTGSFLTNYEQGYTGYGERNLYSPLPIGYLKAVIINGIITTVSVCPV